MRSFFVAAMALATVACGSTTTTPATGNGKADMRAGADMSFRSDCGHPGDKGNSLGVGMFCDTLDACSNNSKATLCTILGDPDNFFCTFRCDANGAANQCGENARCACNGGPCGCFPTACDPPSDGGPEGDGSAHD